MPKTEDFLLIMYAKAYFLSKQKVISSWQRRLSVSSNGQNGINRCIVTDYRSSLET